VECLPLAVGLKKLLAGSGNTSLKLFMSSNWIEDDQGAREGRGRVLACIRWIVLMAIIYTQFTWASEHVHPLWIWTWESFPSHT